jgi:hypothetical protein
VTPADHDLPPTIGRPATGALLQAGYTRLAALDGVPARDLAKLHGVGPTAIERLQAALVARGLSLA